MEIKIAESESKETYAFIRWLIIISLTILFFFLIFQVKHFMYLNITILNWTIYYFASSLFIYITLTMLELKEGAINGN